MCHNNVYISTCFKSFNLFFNLKSAYKFCFMSFSNCQLLATPMFQALVCGHILISLGNAPHHSAGPSLTHHSGFYLLPLLILPTQREYAFFRQLLLDFLCRIAVLKCLVKQLFVWWTVKSFRENPCVFILESQVPERCLEQNKHP